MHVSFHHICGHFRNEDVSRQPGNWAQCGLVIQIFKNDVAESTGHSRCPELLFICEEAIGHGTEGWFHSSKDFQKLGIYLESPFAFFSLY